MNADQDKMLKMMIKALHDSWMSLGGFAWVLLGVLLLVGIAVMLLLLRWIWGGGLARQTSFGFFPHRRVVDKSLFKAS